MRTRRKRLEFQLFSRLRAVVENHVKSSDSAGCVTPNAGSYSAKLIRANLPKGRDAKLPV